MPKRRSGKRRISLVRKGLKRKRPTVAIRRKRGANRRRIGNKILKGIGTAAKVGGKAALAYAPEVLMPGPAGLAAGAIASRYGSKLIDKIKIPLKFKKKRGPRKRRRSRRRLR